MNDRYVVGYQVGCVPMVGITVDHM